jgi:hypothetical protein
MTVKTKAAGVLAERRLHVQDVERLVAGELL